MKVRGVKNEGGGENDVERSKEKRSLELGWAARLATMLK